jgi:hypothetical protein
MLLELRMTASADGALDPGTGCPGEDWGLLARRLWQGLMRGRRRTRRPMEMETRGPAGDTNRQVLLKKSTRRRTHKAPPAPPAGLLVRGFVRAPRLLGCAPLCA